MKTQDHFDRDSLEATATLQSELDLHAELQRLAKEAAQTGEEGAAEEEARLALRGLLERALTRDLRVHRDRLYDVHLGARKKKAIDIACGGCVVPQPTALPLPFEPHPIPPFEPHPSPHFPLKTHILRQEPFHVLFPSNTINTITLLIV